MSEDKDLRQMVTEMHKALIGDEYRKEGFVHKIENHETRLSRLEKYVVGISAIGAFIFIVVKVGSQLITMFR